MFNHRVLAELRKQKVGSLEDLRDRLIQELHVRRTTQTLNNYERGASLPDAEMLEAYHIIFSVPFEHFFAKINKKNWL